MKHLLLSLLATTALSVNAADYDLDTVGTIKQNQKWTFLDYRSALNNTGAFDDSFTFSVPYDYLTLTPKVTYGKGIVTTSSYLVQNADDTYTLFVRGTNTKPGTFYDISFKGQILSPVPEPAEYLMMGIGLGLVVYLINRRKKK